MNTQPDFEELLKLLEENKVEYMIVGGYAVAFYGYPRFTKDIDIYYLNTILSPNPPTKTPTTSEIKFTITDVYPSTKWEDTAISSIEFFLECGELPIDTEKFKHGFKKNP